MKRPAQDSPSARTIGLLGATMVGMSAIVGGGILVLAGAAFQATGPSAILAFALNGAIALLTALSFAEMSTKFPESGGAYNFAKRVLSVRSAFAVGWVLWFAYIVAGVLYALGFASYAIELFRVLFASSELPEWLQGRVPLTLLAILPTLLYAASLIQKSAGGGQWATWGKLLIFALVLAAGLWALAGQDFKITKEQLTPFFPRGAGGLLQAMGLTFIALQGFDLIGAIAGEIKDPVRTIPRAMLLSLGAALSIYLPLLLIVSTVGNEPGQSILETSASHPETLMARAAARFMGAGGYWVLMVAALLSTLSALQANLMAASRVAQSMAGDRTLPAILGSIHPRLKTPHMAIYASALTLVALLLAIPDLAAAGAAASLIFLIAFALAHWTSILARKREDWHDNSSPVFDHPTQTDPARDSFRTPFFPLVPVLGGLACIAMATFQALVVPAAGGITLVWLGLGALLYKALFADRAETYDAFTEAQDPNLAQMRGRNPLVLVPIANPRSAPGMVEVAASLAPPPVGRVVLLRVIPIPDTSRAPLENLESGQAVMTQALAKALASGHRPEALVTLAKEPWREIGRVVRSHDCSGIVLGLPQDSQDLRGGPIETLLNELDCDVTFVRCPEAWSPRDGRRIVVPVGRRGHDIAMRARILGSLQTAQRPEITWVSIIAPTSPESSETEIRAHLQRLAQDNFHGTPAIEVIRSDNPVPALAKLASQHDLLVLGMHRSKNGSRIFGEFNRALLEQTSIAALIIGGGR